MAADPTDNPTLWDHPTLDGIPIPGSRVVRTSGGEIELKIEQAQQVGYAGAFTAVRGQELATVAYRIEAVDKPTRQAVMAWLAVIKVGMEKRATGSAGGSIFKPQVYRFSDPAVEHLKIGSVIPHKMGSWYRPNEKSGLYAVDVSFKEWKKPIKIGGTVAPRAKTETEKQIEDFTAQNKALRDKLDAMNKDT